MLTLENSKTIVIVALVLVWIFFYVASRGVYRIPAQFEMRILKPLTITTSILASIYFYNHELAIGVMLLCLTVFFTAVGILAHPKKPLQKPEMNEEGEIDVRGQLGGYLWKLNRFGAMLAPSAVIVVISAGVLSYNYGLRYYFVILIAIGAGYVLFLATNYSILYGRGVPPFVPKDRVGINNSVEDSIEKSN
jgi:hypothetical protein